MKNAFSTCAPRRQHSAPRASELVDSTQLRAVPPRKSRHRSHFQTRSRHRSRWRMSLWAVRLQCGAIAAVAAATPQPPSPCPSSRARSRLQAVPARRAMLDARC
eukprot:1855889-Rhodomonas_salina.2